MGSTGDPVGRGLTTNLARPSRNVTGTTIFSAELGPKLLELLKQAVPRIARIAYLVNPADPPTWLGEMESTATSLGCTLSVVEAEAPERFDDAFGRISSNRSDALVVQGDTLFGVHLTAIARLALVHRLASTCAITDYADAGGLVAYGPNRTEGYRRAAMFIDKLLKGATPADLPIERPMTFERVVNLKTAAALGLTLPRSLVLSADRVIE
jgi:putative ABC transport system substrate-binding protein